MKQITESTLLELGFTKHLMPGTGWNSINSMRDAVYYYKNGRITINATEFWTWFLDNEMRNNISVDTKDGLQDLLNRVNQ